MDLGKVKKYLHLEDLLDDPDIDLVDVCNPTHLHPQTALAALAAGKHVLVEKAIALTTREADAMVKAAGRAGKLLLVAHVLPFFPEFAHALEAVRGGTHGKLLGGHFKRVISRPDWSADIGDAARTGGPAVDLHIHDTHFIALLAGVPRKVFATGCVNAQGAVDYLTTSYLYGEGGPAITCSSGAVSMKAREFVHGYELYLEKATLVYESGPTPLTLLTADGKSKQPKLKGGADPLAAFTAELQAAADGVAAGRLPELLSGKLARDALALCHAECDSVRSGKVVSV
jgi:predicted dehydrogenase